MPADDLVINVRQISGYPFQVYAGYGDTVVLQAAGPTGSSLNGPYVSMSIQGAVASALSVDQTRGLGVGAPLPLGAGGNILASQGFVAPVNKGVLFNCFASDGGPWGALNYLVSDIAGAMLFSEAGFTFLGFPPGQSLTPVMVGDAAAVLSRTGSLALREQVVVGRDPIGPNEAVTLSYFTLHALVRNPGNGRLNLTTEDIAFAGGATQWNAALAGYPTAQSPVPEAAGNEIVTAQWAREILVAGFNGRHGEVCLTVDDITWAGGAPAFSPHLIGEPLAPSPPYDDDSDRIATTKMVQAAIDAVGTLTGPPGPIGPSGPQGIPGTGINFLGTVPTVADLPTSGNEVGDMYITLDTNDGYIWEIAGGGTISGQPTAPGQAGWILIGMITPQTAVLVSVDPPLNPLQGDLWWDNTTAQLMLYYAGAWIVANLGAAGPQGPAGDPGTAGPPGPTGPPGSSNVPSTAVPPTNPTQGDLWWNPVQNILMVFIGSTWVPAAEGSSTGGAIGALQTSPANAIQQTGWGYTFGAAKTGAGGSYANFLNVVQPELGFPSGTNTGNPIGNGQDAALFFANVNVWNFGVSGGNNPVLFAPISGLPIGTPQTSVLIAQDNIMPQGFYWAGQHSPNQGFIRWKFGQNRFPAIGNGLYYCDGTDNFVSAGNVLGSLGTFIPVTFPGLLGGRLGPPTVFAAGSLIPRGFWYCLESAENVIDQSVIGLAVGPVSCPLNRSLNFMFYSDGVCLSVTTGPVMLHQVLFGANV